MTVRETSPPTPEVEMKSLIVKVEGTGQAADHGLVGIPDGDAKV